MLEGISPGDEVNERLDNNLDTFSDLLETSLSLGLVGATNARRLLELVDSDSGSLSLLPDRLLLLLEKEVEQSEDRPIIPALRVVDDFTTGEDIFFRQPFKGSEFLIRTVDAKIQNHIVIYHAGKGAPSFVEPKYPGVYKLDEYMAFKFPDGRQYGKLRQISSMLALTGYLDPHQDVDLLRQLKRHFGVDPRYLS